MGFVINKNRKNTDVLSVFFLCGVRGEKMGGVVCFLRYEKGA